MPIILLPAHTNDEAIEPLLARYLALFGKTHATIYRSSCVKAPLFLGLRKSKVNEKEEETVRNELNRALNDTDNFTGHHVSPESGWYAGLTPISEGLTDAQKAVDHYPIFIFSHVVEREEALSEIKNILNENGVPLEIQNSARTIFLEEALHYESPEEAMLVGECQAPPAPEISVIYTQEMSGADSMDEVCDSLFEHFQSCITKFECEKQKLEVSPLPKKKALSKIDSESGKPNIHIDMKNEIGDGYPIGTGRLINIPAENSEYPSIKVALVGDSTIDNEFWVDQKKPCVDRTHAVTTQTAMALAQNNLAYPITLANFNVDGLTTGDLLLRHGLPMNKVIPSDADHPRNYVIPLQACAAWNPSTVILSVGGNDYREALLGVLHREIPTQKLLLRLTPQNAKEKINRAFNQVKTILLNNYREIIDKLIDENPNLNRLILVSQYYPALTMFTSYLIYTGFSHVAASNGNGNDAFTEMQNTMHELYAQIIDHIQEKNIEIVFLDMASSLNPVGSNHTMQIEPNEKGSQTMGKMIAEAIAYQFTEEQHENKIIMRSSLNGKSVETLRLDRNYHARTLNEFISHSRYQHLIPALHTSFFRRVQHTYHFFAGNRFDAQYSGVFAFGLLDLTIAPIVASYLWRHVINSTASLVTRIPAAIIAVPILIARVLIATVLTLAVTPIILFAHLCMKLVPENHPVNIIKGDEEEAEAATEQARGKKRKGNRVADIPRKEDKDLSETSPLLVAT